MPLGLIGYWGVWLHSLCWGNDAEYRVMPRTPTVNTIQRLRATMRTSEEAHRPKTLRERRINALGMLAGAVFCAAMATAIAIGWDETRERFGSVRTALLALWLANMVALCFVSARFWWLSEGDPSLERRKRRMMALIPGAFLIWPLAIALVFFD